ncbi:transcriptional regulator [Catellatospora sp. IY07-71]|uniref:ArsR/SmtB family transcription factor n=1 Tax=Catellatospora sp. IY07-71 TaxID=2728827 RepID=UPI001BB41A2D|nr:ArsR family transcriptional regulator [Catellatospora sp. IY07-71]BCJ76619.1 transcriptional regulator [Catellatospora sp. IY07-71]
MFRIHFTQRDVSAVRILAEPSPLWEITLSCHMLAKRNEDPLLAGWHRTARGTLQQGLPLRDSVDLFIHLNWAHGDFPDLLTPGPAGAGVDDGLEVVARTPTRQLTQEVSTVARQRGNLMTAARDLAAGRADAMGQLVTGMRDYFEAVIRPQWPAVTASFGADLDMRTRCMATGGVAAMLNGLHPSVRFDGSVLTITDYPGERDLFLEGRGMVLVPSFFKRRSRPLTLIDPQLPPVLVYPVDRSPGMLAARQTEALSALLGRSRAAILELCAAGGSTTSIAAQLSQSPSTISEHLSVLRNAGLVASDRRGNAMLHRLRPLGTAMLEGQAPSGTAG